MLPFSHQISLSSPEETEAFANRLAPHLTYGDTILLEGPIGSGKSLFSRSLILSILPHPEDIPSPTFTLVQVYDGPKFQIWHCDLYRLTHPDEAWELGLEEAFDSSLCLIEWPDRLAGQEPKDALHITFVPENGEVRLLKFQSHSARWNLLTEVLNA
ncbi:tRNA (adenosine(37)-N6)-threonylcarbamoyltransferase complex ATPase subunit type 1 TsaE [Falsihalocynthiibacter arcticus]|uniref:tRNA threonylcarbamoyladenosine biosynthesis protein TsaE n=1 Tax=Falsihalocynthiibacter arcticus TaxID=1579316 RepID=A0A126UZH1_9RHOB|nr:tRNA (adenosine(37)-N6)-threonylcarbamoyltransferase complex ATPase subunit type 1 TsaE [Falsihalocynthiibacter arcticus]AML50849.1 hypothetical protein RC74_05750 [Falsihalocynthiibacter arcticus]